MRKTIPVAFVALVVAGLLGSGVLPSPATVEIARQEKGAKCVTCHVKMGSKELNAAGRYYAQHKTLKGYPPPAPEKPAAPKKPAVPPKPAPAPTTPSEPAAPAPSQRELLLIVREKVELSELQGYLEVVKDYVAAAQEAKLGPGFNWTAVERDPFTYSFIVPIKELDVLDVASDSGRARLEKFKAAIGAERLKELEARGQAATRGAESWVVESVPELSYQPKRAPGLGQEPVGAVHVDVERVRFDRAEAYEAATKRLLEWLREAEFPYALHAYRTVTGPANTYYYVLGASDLVKLAEVRRQLEQELIRVGGEDGWKQLVAEWAPCLEDFEHYDEVVRPDLSYVSESKEQ